MTGAGAVQVFERPELGGRWRWLCTCRKEEEALETSVAFQKR